MVIPANESSTFFRHPQLLNPVQLGPSTILNLAQKKETLEKVIAVLKLLEPDDFINYMLDFYDTGLAKYGEDWGYADQLTVLCAAASLLRVENYLEIGVFRGRSLALLASQAVDTRLFGFDLWVKNYAGLENPGPEFVRTQLARIGYQGEATLISGRSQETLPAFLEAHPDLYFDVVTVDGDHSYEGARIDLQNVLPRIKIGGVLVFDDIRNPQHLVLEYLWEEIVGTNPNFLTAKYTDIGHGVALAVRCEEDVNMEPLQGATAEGVQTLAGRPPVAEAAQVENEKGLHILQQKLQKTGMDRATLLKMILKMDTFKIDRLLNEAEADRLARLGSIHELEARLQECEADRLARLDAIHTLESLLQESEADRAVRLDAIHTLQNQLQESEADRAVRLDAIHTLKNQLQECEADRAARLDALHTLENQVQESEADRAARLDAIHALQNQLQECEADRAARLEVIHDLEKSQLDLEKSYLDLEKSFRDIQQRLDWMPVRTLLKARDKFTGGLSQP